jgi:hypothetical protein
VFAFIADCRNDPKWAPMVPQVEQIEGDGPGLGARYRIKQGVGGGKFAWMELETTQFVEPTELGWAMSNKAMKYQSRVTLAAIDGGTRMEQTNTIDFGSAVKGAAWFVLANFALRRQLRLLRRALESEAT